MLERLTIGQIKARHYGHFFSKGAMGGFGSRVHSHVSTGATGWFFVTSEQQPPDETYNLHFPRRWTVRKMYLSGDILTHGDFQGYGSLKAAVAAAREAARLDREEVA